MAFTSLLWWTCPHCGASLYYTIHDSKTAIVAAHFQRCAAIHFQLAAMFLRMAASTSEKNINESNSTGR